MSAFDEAMTRILEIVDEQFNLKQASTKNPVTNPKKALRKYAEMANRMLVGQQYFLEHADPPGWYEIKSVRVVPDGDANFMVDIEWNTVEKGEDE